MYQCGKPEATWETLDRFMTLGKSNHFHTALEKLVFSQTLEFDGKLYIKMNPARPQLVITFKFLKHLLFGILDLGFWDLGFLILGFWDFMIFGFWILGF